MSDFHKIVAAWEVFAVSDCALATLVRARGSSYRRVGARMLVASDGKTSGSLSAGCIEEEVAGNAAEVLRDNRPKLVTFDTRRRFGCSGSIEVFIERADRAFLQELQRHFAARTSCTVETVFENSSELRSQIVVGEGSDNDSSLRQVIEPPLRLLVIGSGPDIDALRAQAILLGWETLAIEAITELRTEMDARSAAVIATHNFGRDAAALRHLLPLGLRYLGLIGPRRRRDELLIDVLDSGTAMESELFAPAGLHLAADSAAEIALSVVAEIQCVFAGGSGEPLRKRKVPIHTSSSTTECAMSPQ